MSSLETRRQRQLATAEAQVMQTVAVMLKTVEIYFGEVLPMDLIRAVQDGCNQFAKAMDGNVDFTVGLLFAEVERITLEYKKLEEEKIEARLAQANAGSLPIL